MKKIVSLLMVAVIFLSGCSLMQKSQTCLDCEESLICKVFPNPKTADLILRLGNVEAIKNGTYSKEDALIVIDLLETAVKTAPTYADLVMIVNNYVEFLGPEVLIISSSFQELNQPVAIPACDINMLLIHLRNLRLDIQLV